MSTNPFDELLESTGGNEKSIQERYHTHRINRNAQQKAKILDPSFEAFAIDEVLSRLEDPKKYPGFTDPRHCLVFWARPTPNVKKLAAVVQDKLKAAFPDIWLMPEDCMHMTTMEVTHSRTYEEIQAIVSKASNAFPGIANYTANHRARLVKPYLGFDSTAIALSYLPAAGEPSNDKKAKEHPYTYHHLRRDLFNKCTEAGIEVQSRYVALSAHLTMARFIDQKDFVLEGTNKLDLEKVKRFIAVIEDINEWLERNYWPNIDGDVSAGTEWVAGEGTVVVREGQLWYGGGHTLYEGEGF